MSDRKTIFLDIDGTILEHHDCLERMIQEPPKVLPNVISKLHEWHLKDYYIILTTARPEGIRNITEKQLLDVGIYYNQLIMNLPTGSRIVINDTKPNGTRTAWAFPVERNIGLGDIEI